MTILHVLFLVVCLFCVVSLVGLVWSFVKMGKYYPSNGDRKLKKDEIEQKQKNLLKTKTIFGFSFMSTSVMMVSIIILSVELVSK